MADEKRVDVNIDLHPQFDGEFVERYMGFAEQGIRLVISAALPRNPDEMQKYYNVDQQVFYSKAVKQLLYDADGDLKALFAAGTLKLSADNGEAIARAYERALATKEVRKERTMSAETKAKMAAKKAENKAKVTAADEIEQKTGVTVAAMAAMSPDELIALAKKMKAEAKKAD